MKPPRSYLLAALIVVSVYATLAGRLVAAVWESLVEGWNNKGA